mgnify:CR=1 FL=1
MSQEHRLIKTNSRPASALNRADQNARLRERIGRTLRELVPVSKRITLLVHASANRAALARLSQGMSLKRVKRFMGTRTRTGSSGYFTNIVLENPHRRLFLHDKKGEYQEVLLYLTEVSKLDSAFTAEQFTPVFFRKGRLEGWGWNSLRRTGQGKRLSLEYRKMLLGPPTPGQQLMELVKPAVPEPISLDP